MNTETESRPTIPLSIEGRHFHRRRPAISQVSMRMGGISDPRNKALLKMFNLVDVGERAGSGVPNIFNVWEDEGWVEPVIDEQFNPDRTVLTLEFKKKAAKKKRRKKVAKKTLENYSLILDAMQPDKWYKVTEFVDVVDVKESRIKMLLRQLAERGYVETTGTTKGKMYRKTTKIIVDHRKAEQAGRQAQQPRREESP